MSYLKVLHVIPSLSPQDGGPSFALPLIARTLERAGLDVDVVATAADRDTSVANSGQGRQEPVRFDRSMTHDEVSYSYFRRQTEFYKVSFPLARWLAEHVRDYDLVHIHALFSYSSYAAANIAKRNGVPYIIRPLGVLNRWGIRNRRRFLKQISLRFIEQRIIRNAAAVHYTSQQEKAEAEQSVVGNEGAVIPLAVDVPEKDEFPGPDRFFERFPQARGREIVLFLSRLDKKKGLDLLLKAFAGTTDDRRPPSETNERFRAAGCRSSAIRPLVVIAGDGEKDFVRELQRLAVELGIGSDVLWTGFLQGPDKFSAMAAASIFILPSYSENFGIALVEAMAAGLPSIVSDQVAIAAEAREYDAGIVVPCDTAAVGTAMRELLENPQLRERMSANARRLVNEKFSVEAMSNSLVKLYERVVRRSARKEEDNE